MVDVLIKMEPIPASPKTSIPMTYVHVHQISDDDLAEEKENTEQEPEDEEAEEGDESSKGDHRWLSPPPRTKTRLLSRSHSVHELGSENTLKPEIDPFRRNSTNCEYNQQHSNVLAPLSPVNTRRLDIPQGMTTPNNKLLEVSPDSKSPPVTPNTHLSPISFQQHQAHQNSWKPPQTPSASSEENDTFTQLLQTTAERVLNKLKTRQQDLGKNMQVSRKMRKQQHGVHQPVPRKLQPILRDNIKTPLSRPESNVSDPKLDSDTASIFSSA